jgi:hypothetical protein
MRKRTRTVEPAVEDQREGEESDPIQTRRQILTLPPEGILPKL